MDLIKIIWMNSDNKERASFETIAGDMEATSRIFAKLSNVLNWGEEGETEKNLGPGLPVDERSGGS